MNNSQVTGSSYGKTIGLVSIITRLHVRGVSSWLLGLAYCVFAISVLLVLAPALLSSISADDEHWILETPAHTSGSYWQAIVWSFTDIPSQTPDQGRFSQFAYAMQRLTELFTMDAAVALASPPFLVRAALKLLLFVVNIFVLRAFIRSFQARSLQGELLSLPSHQSTSAAIALSALIAVGAKTQELGSFNGWLHYPVLTYGAVAVIFGSATLMLWLFRKLSSHFRKYVLLAVLISLLLSAFFVASYELYYLAFPVCVVSLIAQPRLNPSLARPWLPKAVVIGSLSVFFVAGVAFTRSYIAQACAAGGCYEGVTPGSVTGTLETTLFNLLSALPWSSSSFSGSQTLEMARMLPPRFTAASLIFGVAFAASIFGVLWCRRHQHQRTTAAHRSVLLRLFILSLVVALGSSSLMALSIKSQQHVTAWGVPFRSGVLTWSSLCLAAVLLIWLVVSSERFRTWQYSALSSVLIVAVGSGFFAATTVPMNYFSAQNSRLSSHTQLVDQIHYEVALGDTSTAADNRRCKLIASFDELSGTDLHGIRTISGAYAAFLHYHGTPFCSEKIGPWNETPTTIY